MPIHGRTIQERIDWLYELGRVHSEAFRSPEAFLARQRYQAEHPTLVAVMKCMDGRIHIPYATQTPMGIIHPLRNLGGIFDLGWPHLGEVLNATIQHAVQKGRCVLLLITYHYSKGDPQRNCAGFNFDTEAAIAHTCRIKQQVEAIFGSVHQTVYPLVCGFETDEDALVLHGNNGERLDLAAIGDVTDQALSPRLSALYPDMPHQVLLDLLPLIQGNAAHIDEVRKSSRELDIVHHEWAICIGRGFDFLHAPNVALIVGPYSPNLGEPISKAAAIIRDNMEKGRIPDDGFLLLASSPYQEIGVDRARAILKARFLAEFAGEVIRSSFAELGTRMVAHTAVLNWPTRELEPID